MELSQLYHNLHHLRDLICVLAHTEGERRAYYLENLYVAMQAAHS